MDLVINGLRLMGKRHGVGRYLEYLLRHWAEAGRPEPFERVLLFTPGAPEDPVYLPAFVEHRLLPTSRSNTYWEQVVLPTHCPRGALLFCPSYVLPLASHNRTVLTHLGSYEALPGEFAWHERLRSRLAYQLSAAKAGLVVTVSECSKRDIARFYGISEHKIRVIPLGVDPTFAPSSDVVEARATRRRFFGTPRPYFLFVGKLARRRNIPQLILAFARFKREQRTDHGLVLIGHNSIGLDVPALAEELGVGGDVLYRAYANHEELVGIYNAADLFIYPSSYEGFGIPVLEAMACGVPTITLNNSAFLEFAKDAAYLATEGSAEVLYRAICDVWLSQELQAQMRKAGVERSRHYGWGTIAEKTMDTLGEFARAAH